MANWLTRLSRRNASVQAILSETSPVPSSGQRISQLRAALLQNSYANWKPSLRNLGTRAREGVRAHPRVGGSPRGDGACGPLSIVPDGLIGVTLRHKLCALLARLEFSSFSRLTLLPGRRSHYFVWARGVVEPLADEPLETVLGFGPERRETFDENASQESGRRPRAEFVYHFSGHTVGVGLNGDEKVRGGNRPSLTSTLRGTDHIRLDGAEALTRYLPTDRRGSKRGHAGRIGDRIVLRKPGRRG
jgi:hypothetical protein